MCGINGFVGENNDLLSKMNRTTTHRGPDYSGIFTDKNISIGHTLLSIRDATEKSKQPFTKKSSPWILAYNGQLYNTKQLKGALGPNYQNEELDTSLLFGMIEKYGWNFIEKIHGMFSIALYNKTEGIIRLYRDPSGQKLLYYYLRNGNFIFSSEIKAILSHTNIDKDVDEDAVMIATSLGWIPGDKTLFKYIKKINLSQIISFNTLTKEFTTDYFKSNSENYYKFTQNVFQNLVEEHLQSKQKVAINLSGGLDSCLLLHEMKQLDNNIHTYTNYFVDTDEKYNTDAILARQLSKDYRTEHREIPITKEIFFNNFIESYSLIEEPNYNISLPTYLHTAKIEGINGDKNRVILSGDGGDEVFGGYPYYLKNKKIDLLQNLLTPFLFNYIKNKRNGTNLSFNNPSDRWLFFRYFYTKYLLITENGFHVDKYLNHVAKSFFDLYKIKKDSIYDTMLLDRTMWLGGENFIRSDKLYMSQSLELRSPLSFHPFRQHFDNILLNKEYISEETNKIFLRDYYYKKLPDYIVQRKDKSGWRAPIQTWYDKKFKNLFLEIITEIENNNTLIDWKNIKKQIEQTDNWPGKYTHLYLSLAILSKQYNLDI